MMVPPVVFYVLVSLLTCYTGCLSADIVSAATQIIDQSSRLRGQVFDEETGKPLPARLVIRDSQTQKSVSDFYNGLPGFFTEPDGSFVIKVPAGNYVLEAFHGIDYRSQRQSLVLDQQAETSVQVHLQPWVKLRDLGWINGECHDHFYSEQPDNLAMLSLARQICLGQGVDFLSVCQGWAGFKEPLLQQSLSKLSDARFLLHFGAEMPKYRFGHTWWLGMNTTRHYFEETMDTVYEAYYQSPRIQLDAADMAFPFIPAVEVVPRLRALLDTVAIHAHPTSWWWKEPEQTKFVTNMASEITFDLLSGKLWDGLVVMGYGSDHYFYQNLWFHLLNEGYRLSAFSELDSGNTLKDPFYYGRLRTYYHVKDGRSMANIVAAARMGHTFVTSGPIVFATVDQTYEPGDLVLQNGGEPHVMDIEAYASGDLHDYLSYVVLFRNGQISKLWDVRDKKPRHVTLRHNLESREKSWYVVKVYGKRAWADPMQLDVMEFCQQREQGRVKNVEETKDFDVAITSPFYFWPPGIQEPEPVPSRISLHVVKSNGELAKDVTVEVLLFNVVQSTHTLKNGEGVFNAPINSWLKISAPGAPTIRRGIFMDYPPFVKIMQNLWTGAWLTPTLKQVLHPGEVPWSVFQFDRTKKILSNIDWIIELTPNERDPKWELFNTLISLSPHVLNREAMGTD